ncbi:hypothetical protein N7513_011562 [Penicillium frequentans]|nr:hypothetical protein N7513_011562 [Penicillium glabrum]
MYDYNCNQMVNSRTELTDDRTNNEVFFPLSLSPSFVSEHIFSLGVKTNTGIDIHGTGTQACKTLYIPRGAKINWVGTKGGQVLEVFTVYTQQGKCSGSYRTVAGQGEINASSDVYGYVVKA